jgi:hypothetical protein
MRPLLFLIVVLPTAISTADVCCRLYEIRAELAVFNITTTTTGPPPFCDMDDMCHGLTVDDQPVTCDDAFAIITRHNQRPPLEAPPIIVRSSRFQTEVNADFVASLNDTDHSRDLHFFRQMRPEFQALIVSMGETAGDIVERMRMFPRLFYDDQIDGPLLEEMNNITESVNVFMEESGPTAALVVIKLIHRSFWFREWSFHVQQMVRYVSELALDEMDLVMVSISPTRHAYSYFCSSLEIEYPFSIDWSWILTPLSKYHPLYITDPVWVIAQHPQHVIPVEIQFGPDIDWRHFQDIVWQTGSSGDTVAIDRQLRNRKKLAEGVVTTLRRVVTLRHRLRAEESMGDSRGEKEYILLVHVLHRLVYTLRYLGRETEIDIGAVIPEMLHVVANPTVFRIGHFSVTTLVRLTRSRLSPEFLWSLINPPTIKNRACDALSPLNISYTPSRQPNMKDFIDGILSVDQYGLSQKTPLRWRVLLHTPGYSPTITEIYRDALVAFFGSRMLSRNTTLAGDSVITISPKYRTKIDFHTALGRLIGISLRSPFLRTFLRPFWTRSQPTTLLETIFFGSHYVRRGVYDVIPYGVLEKMFPNAQALVHSLPH